MAETLLATASERQVWLTKYFQEYVRYSRFAPYMSNADINKGGIILTKFQRETESFRTINIPFIGRLKSAGVTGAGVLAGNEEELTNYNCPITIDWRRNAVDLPKSTTFRTEINLWNAARDALLVWESEKLRDDIIKAQAMMVTDTAGTCVPWDTCTTAQQTTWITANEDRILYIVGYSWHWDLDETKKTLMQYRDTIVNLLTPLGFRQYPTNEPNVSLRAENLFMARIGANIDRAVKRRFTNLLFGMGED